MAAPTLPLVTAEEYLNSSDMWLEWEFDNGVLLPRHFGSSEHSRLIMRLGLLVSHEEWLTPYATLVVRIPGANRYRVPDVCCYPSDKRPPEDLDQQRPPLAIFEVLSRSDELREVKRKCADYRALGVDYVFLVDPDDETVVIPSGPGFAAVDTISFEHEGRRAEITLADLFAQ